MGSKGLKLTAQDVVRIRDRYSKGGILQKELAEEFGVSHQLVSAIVNRSKWKRA
jgi:DNA-binding transcriptional regulator LsrR (DeoR family)